MFARRRVGSFHLPTKFDRWFGVEGIIPPCQQRCAWPHQLARAWRRAPIHYEYSIVPYLLSFGDVFQYNTHGAVLLLVSIRPHIRPLSFPRCAPPPPSTPRMWHNNDSATGELEPRRRGRLAQRDGVRGGRVCVRLAKDGGRGAPASTELAVRPNRETAHLVFASQDFPRGQERAR